jgi:hypothetical protein
MCGVRAIWFEALSSKAAPAAQTARCKRGPEGDRPLLPMQDHAPGLKCRLESSLDLAQPNPESISPGSRRLLNSKHFRSLNPKLLLLESEFDSRHQNYTLTLPKYPLK